MAENSIGKTKHVGYEVGIRHTFEIPIEVAWKFMFSKEGLKIWLGADISENVVEGMSFQTLDQSTCIVKVIKELSHIRMRYQKNDWSNNSTLQVRFISVKTGTTISFHQENLLNSEQRMDMLRHWENVLDELKTEL